MLFVMRVSSAMSKTPTLLQRQAPSGFLRNSDKDVGKGMGVAVGVDADADADVGVGVDAGLTMHTVEDGAASEVLAVGVGAGVGVDVDEVGGRNENPQRPKSFRDCECQLCIHAKSASGGTIASRTDEVGCTIILIDRSHDAKALDEGLAQAPIKFQADTQQKQC